MVKSGIAIALAAIVCSLAAPLPAAQTPSEPASPFGLVCPWSGVEDAGVRWIRCGAGATALDWAAVEPSRGSFSWAAADWEMDSIVRRDGMGALPILGYTPQWASADRRYPPTDLADWSRYVFAMANRYKDRARYWEVWNEEDTPGFWMGGVDGYVNLLKSACVAAKSADPSCMIVFGGMAGVDLNFLDRAYECGAGGYFDVMAVHPYQWGDTFNDVWFTTQLRDLHALMAKRGDGDKEIWLTELGWSTGDAGITEEIQARLLAQVMVTSLTLRDANVTRVFSFCAKDWGGPGYGIIRPDGSRKPAFAAYRTVTGTLEGADYVRSISEGEVRRHLFYKNGAPILVAWRADKEHGETQLPGEYRWISARRSDGRRVEIANGRIPVGPEPVFVLGVGSVGQTIAKRPAPKPVRPSNVWLSCSADPSTSRPFVVRGKESSVRVSVHNDSDRAVSVALRGRIGKTDSAPAELKMAPRGVESIAMSFRLPSDAQTGLSDLRLNVSANGKRLPDQAAGVRVTEGRAIEFTANSSVECRYLHKDNASGGAPSVRFNGSWVYKFDLSGASSARVRLLVGAHMANEWRVLASSDEKTWQTILSGKSVRSWHEADISSLAGGPLFLKFEGNDQQLEELLLTMTDK